MRKELMEESNMAELGLTELELASANDACKWVADEVSEGTVS